MYNFKFLSTKGCCLRLYWPAALVILLASGLVYRHYASHLKVITKSPVSLPIPLRKIPYQIDNWYSHDVPIPEYIQRIAGLDDFLNRFYINNATNQWANIYLAYSARPRTMTGHKPVTCYTAGGWVHETTERSQFTTSACKTIPCLVHRFHKPTETREEIIVLNFYILNGKSTADENSFSGLGWRTPNIAGDPARYVAQIQISSTLETSVRSAAEDLAEQLIKFLPDETGRIKISQNITY